MGVGVQSILVVHDVHDDMVDATYMAIIKSENPGHPVRLHVLLPEGTRVLEAKFYPRVRRDLLPYEFLNHPELKDA